MTPTLRATATALALAVLPGCVLGIEGVNQNLALAVESPDPVLLPPSASLPIATGSTITYAIYDLEPLPQGSTQQRTRAPASLRTAWVDADSAISLGPVEKNLITVVAARPGRARLHVRSARGFDEFDVEVRDIGKVQLLDAHEVAASIHEKGSAPALAFGGAPLALRDDSVRFVALASDEAGSRLLGLGPHAPIDVAPMDSARVEPAERDLEHATVTFLAAGQVTLTPRGGAALSVDVVEPAEVASLRLVASSAGLTVGGVEALFAVGTLRGRDDARWLMSSRLAFASLSPSVCKVDTTMPTSFASGFAFVSATARGTCELGVELGAGAPTKVFATLELAADVRR
ncbi:MAG: hypothetical protein U0271_27360 [Polyangiaceae bacterium]